MDSQSRLSRIAISSAAILALVFGAVPRSSMAAVDFSGYVDVGVESVDMDGAGVDSNTGGLFGYHLEAKAELDEGVTAEAHIAGDGENDIWLEQAHIVYAASDEVSLIMGKYLSKLGWEAFHSRDLYQYSTSATLVYPGMMNGAGITYAKDAFSIYAAVLAGVWDSTDTDMDEIGFEAQLKLNLYDDALTIQLGYATEETAATTNAMGAPMAGYDASLVNIWISYKLGKLTLAAEVNDLTDWRADGVDGDGYLVMARLMLTDRIGLTVRQSAIDVGMMDMSEIAVSPSFKVTDNWLVLAEYQTTDNDAGADMETIALESIFTF